MADSDLQYLSPNFDPGSLTVPRLRSILVEHDVAYPSSAKKSQLVDIFNDEVVPQARRILGNRARTKRSTRGISDVPSSAEPSVNGDEMGPVETPRSTRRTPRASVTRSVDEHSPPRTLRSTRSSRASSSVYSESEAESTRATPVPRRERNYVETPAVKEEEEEEEVVATVSEDVQSPFTQDNPFQSKSPAQDTTPIPAERRRRTLGPTDEKKKSESNLRRRTEFGARKNDVPVSKSRKSLVPLAKNDRNNDVPTNGGPEPGEEFTAEEQMDLEAEEAHGKLLNLTVRPQKRGKNSLLASALWAISLAMLGGVATLWRQEKLEVGYCGAGQPSTAIAGIYIPEWADSLRPQCEVCPPHAYCYSKMRLNCEPGFIMQAHPLSLGGLVPLPPTCEADGEKARKVKAVADRAVEELRDRNAKWECGELRDADGKREQQVAIQEPILKEAVSSKRRKGMSQEEFEDLWEAAMGEVVSRDEILTSVDGPSSTTRTLRSTSLALVPFPCAVRRSLRLALARHLWQLVSVITLICAALYARFSFTSSRTTEAVAKRLASAALDRLAAQAALAARDRDAMHEAWISASQLRDDVLRSEFSAKKRQKVWAKVARKVEDNSNVRSAVRESRSGEVSRVWEWVGAVPAGLLEERTGDGVRLSLGTPLARGGSPTAYGTRGVRVKDEGASGRGSVEGRRWDEGRAVY